jgi:hypothetical protein
MSVSLVKSYVSPAAAAGREVYLPGGRAVFVRKALSDHHGSVLLRVVVSSGRSFGEQFTTCQPASAHLSLA